MNGYGWRILTRITNDKLDKFRVNFLKPVNREVAFLSNKSSL